MSPGSFYKIENLSTDQQSISAGLVLDARHEIFKGHFPGMPVLPGVCMVEIIKGILEKVIEQKTNLKSAHHIKFLHILDPNVHPEVLAELKYKKEEEEFRVSAKLHFENIIFFKIDALFAL